MTNKLVRIVWAAVILTVLPVAQAQIFTIVATFRGGQEGEPDPGMPPLAHDQAGNLYGASPSGGGSQCYYSTGCGTIYKLDPTGKVTTLYRFSGPPDGSYPEAVIRDSEGNLYGTTRYGGTAQCSYGIEPGCGTVFKVDAAGKETVLHSFGGPPDGQNPFAGLVRDAKGNLYGTTYLGGKGSCNSTGCGTVFKIDPAGKETVLYRFGNGADGGLPLGNLLLVGGVLYGTTASGGTGSCTNSVFVGCGTVFNLKGRKETVLYRFTGPPDGAWPIANVVRDRKGNLYGTASGGGDTINCPLGPYGCGTVFKLDLARKETILYTFNGQNDGYTIEGLVIDAQGNLYGTAEGPFDYNSSATTVFKVDTSGQFTVLHSFGTESGYAPGDLIIDHQGNLYGTAVPMVFKLTP
ncbi:MAG TPA: choice-of-anchor tandem repeat GloVer-containing protein [Terriglobales bacterium]|nr:choice-of-anchor tandem repeat GloVer-containing protein [Terriglobales bacterium]